MTIRREVVFLGLLVSRTNPLSGFSEELRSDVRLGGSYLAVQIQQPDDLLYATGRFTGFEYWRGERVFTGEAKWRRLSGPEINRYDTSKSFLGIKVTRYRWVDDGAKLTVLPPRKESESA